jgi:hypothetical protein
LEHVADVFSELRAGAKPNGVPCYTQCPTLGMINGAGQFLDDSDVKTAKDRLSKSAVYQEHLQKQAAGGNLYEVAYLTNRQKRVVAYLKVYRHMYGVGQYRVRKDLPACVCLGIRVWWPDDQDDVGFRGRFGEDEDDLSDPFNM